LQFVKISYPRIDAKDHHKPLIYVIVQLQLILGVGLGSTELAEVRADRIENCRANPNPAAMLIHIPLFIAVGLAPKAECRFPHPWP